MGCAMYDVSKKLGVWLAAKEVYVFARMNVQ